MRPRKRGDRAVGVPGEPVDGVGGGGVAVDVAPADARYLVIYENAVA
jgi:hypothetical protein